MADTLLPASRDSRGGQGPPSPALALSEAYRSSRRRRGRSTAGNWPPSRTPRRSPGPRGVSRCAICRAGRTWPNRGGKLFVFSRLAGSHTHPSLPPPQEMSEADTVKDLKVCLRDSHVAIMCACFGGAGSLLCVSRPAPGSSVAHPSDGFLAAPSKSEEARGHYPRARQPAHGIPARCPLCPASHTHPEETQCSLHTPAAPASCPHAALGTHQFPPSASEVLTCGCAGSTTSICTLPIVGKAVARGQGGDSGHRQQEHGRGSGGAELAWATPLCSPCAGSPKAPAVTAKRRPQNE